ncbi:MAG: toll/interleukin-1 receptor domain-containing protein [Lachnospiraceae bacterium]|nr:toll/interleukin-1 receptor domain-containing protein [Lachnospiraceae bacterium]
MIRRKIEFSHHVDVPFSQKEIVFVSYRHIDKKICDEVLNQLYRIPSVAVWVDNQLSAGEYFDNEVEQAMGLSDVIVQVVTENFFTEGSYTMNRELPLAHKYGLTVVAVPCGNASDKELSYIQEHANYVCPLDDCNSIQLAFEKIHSEFISMGFKNKFMHLAKRIGTWYLTPKDMFELADGYLKLLDAREEEFIPPQLTEDTVKRYIRAAAFAGIDGTDYLMERMKMKQ